MNKGFVGGLLATGSRLLPESGRAVFQWSSPDHRNWVWSWGMNDQIFIWDRLVILILGHLKLSSQGRLLPTDGLAEELRWRYIEEGSVDLSGMDGNATVILLDSQLNQLHLARPANSLFPTYYQGGDWGVRFASTPALLAQTGEEKIQPDRPAALNWVHKGLSIDRETLFQGIYRLLPGEVVVVSEEGLSRYSISDSLDCPQGERINAKSSGILQTQSRPWVELNGSMASMAVQVLRNQNLTDNELLPCSTSLCLDFPSYWQLTDRAVEASRILGTEHHLILPQSDVVTAWKRSLAATGEPLLLPRGIFGADYSGQLRQRGVNQLWIDSGFDSRDRASDPGIRSFQEAERFVLLLEQAGIRVMAPFLDSRWLCDPGNSGMDGNESRKTIVQQIPKRLEHQLPDDSQSLECLASNPEVSVALEQMQTHGLCSINPGQLARPEKHPWLYRLLAYNYWFEMFVVKPGVQSETRPSVVQQLQKAS